MDSEHAQAFRAWCRGHQAALLADPQLHALGYLAHRALSEAAVHIAQLRAQLDRYTGREVHYTTDAHLDEAATSISLWAPPGTIVRATDTGRELELTPTGWEPR